MFNYSLICVFSDIIWTRLLTKWSGIWSFSWAVLYTVYALDNDPNNAIWSVGIFFFHILANLISISYHCSLHFICKKSNCDTTMTSTHSTNTDSAQTNINITESGDPYQNAENTDLPLTSQYGVSLRSCSAARSKEPTLTSQYNYASSRALVKKEDDPPTCSIFSTGVEQSPLPKVWYEPAIPSLTQSYDPESYEDFSGWPDVVGHLVRSQTPHIMSSEKSNLRSPVHHTRTCSYRHKRGNAKTETIDEPTESSHAKVLAPSYWNTICYGQCSPDGFELCRLEGHWFDSIQNVIHSAWTSPFEEEQNNRRMHHDNIEITDIYNIHNNSVWERYQQTTDALLMEHTETHTQQPSPWKHISYVTIENVNLDVGTAKTKGNLELDIPLSDKTNEIFLFHGTREKNFMSICEQGIKINKANPDGHFGPGIYATDSPTKANQYTGMSACTNKESCLNYHACE